MGTIRAWAVPRRRAIILIGMGLAIITMIAGIMAAGLHLYARRHRASSYGISDPASTALRVENHTRDFVITRIIIEDQGRTTIIADVRQEVLPEEKQVIELAAGRYIATVRFVEIMRTPTYLSPNDLFLPLHLDPGKAVILSLEDGIASPETRLYLPPRLVSK